MPRKSRKSMRVIKKKKRSKNKRSSKNKYLDGVKELVYETDQELVYSETSPEILEEGYVPGLEPKSKSKSKPPKSPKPKPIPKSTKYKPSFISKLKKKYKK